jgi:hypothetical protein
MSSYGHAECQQQRRITDQECLAIRALDRDEGYTRSEIAFLFETRVETVAHHATSHCAHCAEEGEL